MKPWILRSVFSGAPITFDTDYQTVLDVATGLGYALPTMAERIIQNQLVLNLKSGGIWTLADVIRIWANNGGSQFGSLNWKNPSAIQASLVNSPTFTPNVGVTGNGTTSYINEAFIPATHGVNYTQNNAGIYVRQENETAAGSSMLFGVLAANTVRVGIQCRNASNQAVSTINLNAVPALIQVNSTTTGGWLLRRVNSTDQTIYKNGVLLGTAAQATSGRPDSAIFSCARNNNGTPDQFVASTVSVFVAGSGFNGLESTMNTLFGNYMTAIAAL